jgi:NADPH-dependent 2,4-dienoyl-CoA reductase/sulfur reductase-like enzyme/rhodanese-related sulfurtransferase
MKKRILIVGGVAGGASCATRLRRLDEEAEITIFDRGGHVSFANCGLPYYVGNVIDEASKLIIADAALFQERFNIQVRLRTEVVRIDRQSHEIETRDLETGKSARERYDALVLSPGASPVRPPLPGIDLPGIFTLRSIPDSERIRQWIETRGARRAVIVGGGFIGLEMAENLLLRGLDVTVVEMLNQLLPPLDPEMAQPVEQRLAEKGVKIALGDGVAGFEKGENGGVMVRTSSGAGYEGDLVLLAIGVRPETGLAKSAGLEIGERGGIRVNEQMQTSDPRIWAVGDVIEVRDFVTGQWALVPLAGPANRQGRIAADAICGRKSVFRGTQGTAICGVLGLTVAMTGASEKSLKRAGQGDYDKVYLHPSQHAGYYPGAKAMGMKIIFRKSDGVILGAQAFGEEGVDKRMDVLAMAIQKGATVHDLEEAELCYAPQYGAAKDPVNMAGMTAANVLRGDCPTAAWESCRHNGYLLLDVRDADEFASGHIPRAQNIPLAELRLRLSDLPKDTQIHVYCGMGQRAYYATRLLRQHGFEAFNLPGGYRTYRQFMQTP